MRVEFIIGGAVVALYAYKTVPSVRDSVQNALDRVAGLFGIRYSVFGQ